MANPAVTILSGGMDSATLAYWANELGYNQTLISFNYGQRHSRELDSAKAIADSLSTGHHVIDISEVKPLFVGSSQTDPLVAVPEGHYSAETMRSTVVPNRNAIMLAIAYGAAVAVNATRLFYGAHAGDHYIYPDCRPEFIEAISKAFALGNTGFGDPDLKVTAPFKDLSKAQILEWGLKYKVPYELTWTCYKGEGKACGKCGSCCERLEAFDLNKAVDPIEYEDTEFWKTAKV